MDGVDAQRSRVPIWQVLAPSRWAIATRSAAVSAVVVIASLALTAAILLALLYGALMSSEDDVTAARAADIVASLQSDAPSELDDVLMATDQPLTAIQIVGQDGQVLRSSADAPAEPLLPPSDVPQGVSRGLSGVDATGHDLRISAQSTDTAAGTYTVLVAADTAAAKSTVKSAAVLLVAIAPLVLAETATTNYLLVKRSLRSVDQIRSRVADISASDLTGRVPVPETRDEIAALATTMNEMLARIEAGHAVQRRFVGDASHELRSPLAGIISTLEVVEAHPNLLNYDLVVGALLPEAHRMKALIDDLLLLARADEQALTRRTNTVDLEQLISAETARLRAATSLTVNGHADDIRIPGDEIALSRMLRNLLDNAARHARSQIEVTAQTRDGSAVIIVTDDGPGIPEDDQVRVFDRFVRLDTDRSRHGGGSGLGLAIVAEIVESHDGTVSVDTSPAGGARVTVTLPFHR